MSDPSELHQAIGEPATNGDKASGLGATCEDCGDWFASEQALRMHTQRKHTDIEIRRCEWCQRDFIGEVGLRTHQRACEADPGRPPGFETSLARKRRLDRERKAQRRELLGREPRKRGRPPGSRNRPKHEIVINGDLDVEALARLLLMLAGADSVPVSLLAPVVEWADSTLALVGQLKGGASRV
jgi:hypothetical protein